MSAIEARATSAAAQLRAADPAASVFVEANAGSGKTRVLVTRVIRLLLGGADLQRIVCLTFTRAAAAEMASRLFATLASWIPLSDEALIARIDSDCGVNVGADDLARARRLFARAIETPGGLKVQTIHGFCESVLQRFPVEAGVVPGFRVLEDVESAALLELCLDLVLDRALAEEGSAVAVALRQIIPHLGEESLRDRIREFMGHEERASDLFDRDPRLVDRQLAQALDVGDGIAPVWSIDEDTYRQLHVHLLFLNGKNNLKTAKKVLDVLEAPDAGQRRRALLELLFTAEKPRNLERFISANGKPVDPAFPAFIAAEQQRVLALEDRARAFEVYELTQSLMTVARSVIGVYKAEKQRRSMFDFADLIAATERLLEGSRASFVLYKLDGGIDHILIDEAQDTSPAQWRIIERLCEEFFAGEGARSQIGRTLFAVGDPKQSIFSFQGADPRCFAAMRERFRRRVTAAGFPFETVPLLVSWRSSPVVLSCVDAVLAAPGVGRQVSGENEPRPHQAVDGAMPGVVEMWPVLETEDRADQDVWLPQPPGGELKSAERREARRIAAAIRRWIDTGERVAPGGPAIRYGSILILVRRRRTFMDEIVRALRALSIPVAGADRLRLIEHVAVEDLLAAARAALLPDDELSLAEVLKGSLFGLNDDDLMALCLDRGRRTLRQQLRDAAVTDERLRNVNDRLMAMRADAAACGPYTFFARILVDGGRQRMLTRLGPDAAEPIDELLNLALDQETGEGATLAHFMGWITAADPTIKRDMENADQVRVMTVHGAKGLEADVVIVADTGKVPENKTQLLMTEHGIPVWSVSKRFGCEPIHRLKVQADVATQAEYQRLLYVAMTRARHRLVITGHDQPKSGSWYETVDTVLSPVLEPVTDAEGKLVLRRLVMGTEMEQSTPVTQTRTASQPIPAWLPVTAAPEPSRRLTPSGMGTALAVPPLAGAGGGSGSKARGILIHRLLEALPGKAPEQRVRIGRAWLSQQGVEGEPADAILSACLSVLDDPRFAALFGESSLAEVPLIGTITVAGSERVVSGRIDRLAIDGDTVWITDFKSDAAPPPDVAGAPPTYVLQLALYHRLIAQMYPGRVVKAALLWTVVPRLDVLPAAALEAMLTSVEAVPGAS